MNFAEFYLHFILLYAQHILQVNPTPCTRAPCFAQQKDAHTWHVKRTKRNQEGKKNSHLLTALDYPTNYHSEEKWRRFLEKINNRGVSRDHIGFLRLPPGQMSRKIVPKAYMSTQRYPRGPKIAGTYQFPNEQLGIEGNSKRQLGTYSSSLGLKNKVGPQGNQDFGRGQRMGTKFSPLTKMVTHRNLQGQIMQNVQEYWWKSGYIEGLKRKFGEAARKSAFPSETSKGISTSRDRQRFRNEDNEVHIRESNSNTENRSRRINQPGKGTSEGAKSSNTGRMWTSEDKNTRQSNVRVGPMSKNVGQTGVTDGQMRTHTKQIGTSGNELGKNMEHADMLRDTNTRHSPISENTNLGNWIQGHQRTSEGVNTGQTRLLEDRMGTNSGQTKTTANQMDRNTRQQRILESRMSRNGGQTRTTQGQRGTQNHVSRNNGQTRTTKYQMDANRGQSGISKSRMNAYTGQIRTTESQLGSNTGQAGTLDGQARTPEGQSRMSEKQAGTLENDSMQQENTEIANSSPECLEPVDLVFLVDGSGSIDPFRQFPQVRKFLKELSAAFQIGPSKTKIAMVQFSGKVSQKVEFGFDQYSDLKGVIEGIDRMEQLRGNTFVGEGFKLVSREIFSPGKGDRPEVRNVLMLFTDGAASDFDVAKEEAAKLKNNGTTIICVGAGQEFMLQFFRSQLQEFASDPPEQYVLTKGFEALDKVVNTVTSITCEEAKNPPAPAAEANTSVDVNLNSYKTASHYWAFDVVNGDIVTDLIGRKRCTLTGGAHLFMSVKRKSVCSMVESGGYLDFGSWAGECITDPDLCTEGLTITMWLRIQAKDVNYNSEYQYIISSGAEGESMRGIVFLLKAKDEIYKLLVRTTSQAWSITLPADRIPNVWFSFAFAWKRILGLAVYLNGFKVEENLKPTNVEGNEVSNSLFIARPATSTNLEYQTKFRIDDFAIFYRFMTDQEVQGVLFEVSGSPSQGGADLCSPNPCKNGGNCSPDTDTPAGFVCQCLPGQTGDLCNQGTSQTSGTSGGQTSQSQGSSTSPGETQGPGQSPSDPQGSSTSPGETQGPGQSPSDPQGPSTTPGETQGPGQSPSEPQGPSTTPGETQGPGQSPSDPQVPSIIPGNTQGPGQSSSDPQGPSTTPGETQGPGQSPSEPQGPSTTPGETQGPGQSPSEPQGPSITPGETQGPGQSPSDPQGPSTIPGNTQGPGQSTSGETPVGSKTPAGETPVVSRPEGQTPPARPKDCPPCPDKSSGSGTSGRPNSPEASSLPGTSNPSGTSNSPGASNLPGASNPSGTSNSPGASNLPGASNPSGTSNSPGASNLPGASNPSGTSNPPGTSNPSGIPNTPGTSKPANTTSGAMGSEPNGVGSSPDNTLPSNPQVTPGEPSNPQLPTSSEMPNSQISNTPQSNPNPANTPKSSSNTPENPSISQGNPGPTQQSPNTPDGSQGTSSTPQGQGMSSGNPHDPGKSSANTPNKPITPQGTSNTPGASHQSPTTTGSTSTPNCTTIPPGSKICSSAPSRSLADAAHTFHYSLPPVLGPYDTADGYNCSAHCMSDCTSGGCSDACCGSCPPVCRKVCRSDCPSRCCGKDAIIPQRRRQTIAKPSRVDKGLGDE